MVRLETATTGAVGVNGMRGMPRYQFGRTALETLDNLTLDEARARLEGITADEHREREEARRKARIATPEQLEGARLLAEKWEEDDIGGSFIGPQTTEIVLVATSWAQGAVLERYDVGGYRAWAEAGLTMTEVRHRIAISVRRNVAANPSMA